MCRQHVNITKKPAIKCDKKTRSMKIDCAIIKNELKTPIEGTYNSIETITKLKRRGANNEAKYSG